MSWTFEWGYFNTEGCAISDNCSSYQGLCGVCLEFLPMWWERNFLLSQRLYLHQLLFALLLNLLLIHMQVVPWRVKPCGLWFKRIFGETRDIILYFLGFLHACGNLFSYVFFSAIGKWWIPYSYSIPILISATALCWLYFPDAHRCFCWCKLILVAVSLFYLVLWLSSKRSYWWVECCLGLQWGAPCRPHSYSLGNLYISAI